MKRKHRDPSTPKGVLQIITAACILFGVCAAPPVQSASELEQQRALFLQAEHALSNKRLQSFATLRDQLSNYPLHPYLVHLDLSNRLQTASELEVTNFLTSTEGTPLGSSLRARWLQTLAKAKSWDTFKRHYKPTSDTELRCHWLNARLKTGERDQVFAQVPALWLTGKSQPGACDPVFSAWRDNGAIEPELLWDRFALAMEAGRPSLARYLTRFLRGEQSQFAKLWLQIRDNPNTTATILDKHAADPRFEQVLRYGFERAARKDPDHGVTLWRSARNKYPWNEVSIAAVKRRIGLSYAYRHDKKALEWLSSVPTEHADEATIEWHAAAALYHQDWQQARDAITRLSGEARDSERWQYWHARATDTLAASPEAKARLRDLARERSYYGFLAADYMGVPYSMRNEPLSFSESELKDIVGSSPGIARAKELYLLGRYRLARNEWIDATRGMGKRELTVAAKLAQEWGWHERAIITVAKAPHWDDIELRFPTAHADEFRRQSDTHRLNPAWVLAIARQESAFMPDAQSSAGALGLMQLMPRTGREVARTLNAKLKNKRDLLNPQTNIRLGTAYLRTLLTQFSDNPILATAAYNAGPSRVTRWRSRDDVPFDVWVENVPFSETRDYLRRVLAYTVVYEHRLGETPTRLERLLARWESLDKQG